VDALTAEVQRWFAGRTFHGPRGQAPYGNYQAYAVPTLALVYQYAQQYGTVVHAGGHIGLVSLALAARFARVVTFEPAADNYAWLAQNVGACPRIQATYGALGDGQPVALVRAKYSACHHAKGPGTIPCYRIDDLGLAAVDVLLLDIEGGELLALQHAVETLRRCRPLLIVEEYPRWMRRYDRQPWDVARFVAELGYRQVGTSALDVAFAFEGEQ
jgi:FkbM family methyltransferase